MIRYTLALVAVLGTTLAASAAPIIYTEQATASGSIGGTNFSGKLVTITMTGDTAGVTGVGTLINVATGTSTVSIAGVGTFNFTIVLHAFNFQGGEIVGISRDSDGRDILDTRNAVFATYDLATAIGPINGAAAFNSGTAFSTSGGNFILTNTGDQSIFQARLGSVTAVPEPATLAVFGGIALAGAFGYRRRKASAAA